jgi:hypothetical protein
VKTDYFNPLRALLCALLLAMASPGFATNAANGVHPVTLADNNTETRIQFSAMGRDFTLLLTPSRFNDVDVFYNTDLDQRNSVNPTNLTTTVLEGTVEGNAQSWVRITLNNGLPSGYIQEYGQLLRLAPWQEVADSLSLTHKPSDLVLIDTSSQHLIATPKNFSTRPVIDEIRSAPPINPSLQNNAPYDLLTDALNDALNDSQSAVFSDTGKDVAFSRSIQTRSNIRQRVTRAIRIGIVIDSRFNDVHNQRGLARALSIINAVDGIYQEQLGVAIELEGIRVYDNPDTDPMRDQGGTVETILNNFRQLRLEDERLSPDLTLVHLFTGHKDPESIIGLGWLNTACRVDGFDLSVSTPYPFDTLLTAHEIAHNLGAFHDDDPRCAVFDLPQNNTLMWSNISGNTTNTFSACSVQSMQASIQDSCNLDNIDMSLALQAYRGNQTLQRSILIEVQNTDFARTARSVQSVTRFPDGTALSNISAGCTVEQNLLRCNHGDMGASDVRQALAVATLPNFSRDDVQSELILPNSADINGTNNWAAISMLNPVAVRSEPTPEVNSATDNQLVTIATVGNVNASGGVESAAAEVGAVSRWALLALVMFGMIGINRVKRC